VVVSATIIEATFHQLLTSHKMLKYTFYMTAVNSNLAKLAFSFTYFIF